MGDECMAGCLDGWITGYLVVNELNAAGSHVASIMDRGLLVPLFPISYFFFTLTSLCFDP